jgi:hypothetical protein
MPEVGRGEAHFRRTIGVFLRELQQSRKQATLTEQEYRYKIHTTEYKTICRVNAQQGAGWAFDHDLPFVDVRVVDQTHRESINRILDQLLELILQQNCTEITTTSSLCQTSIVKNQSN